MFVLFIYHFWTRNRQILNFEHFELVLARFYSVNRDKISRWRSPKVGFYTKLSHCKRNWDFSCKIVAPRNFFVFNGDFGGFQWGNFQNSEFAYYASKSGKCIKQTPTPPFWGDVGVKKWSQFFDSGTPKPIFGHLKMGTFAKL